MCKNVFSYGFMTVTVTATQYNMLHSLTECSPLLWLPHALCPNVGMPAARTCFPSHTNQSCFT